MGGHWGVRDHIDPDSEFDISWGIGTIPVQIQKVTFSVYKGVGGGDNRSHIRV